MTPLKRLGAALLGLLALAAVANAGGRQDLLGAIVNQFVQDFVLNLQGPTLTRGDTRRLGEAHQYALEHLDAGALAGWDNPRTGHSGAVVPGRPFRDRRGNLCRPFTHTIAVRGIGFSQEGIACRHPHGYWQTID